MKEKLCITKRKITPEMVGLDCFSPVYESDFLFMQKCKYHKEILTSSRRPRNPRHHKLIFAIAKCVLTNLPEGHFLENQEPYDIVKAILLKNKIVDYRVNLDGSVRAEAKSIAFESMDEDEFSKISDVIFKEAAAILGIEESEFKQNYQDYL